MGLLKLILVYAMTFSVTAFGRVSPLVSPSVKLAFSKTIGLEAPAEGFASIEEDAGGGRWLQFTVQGQMSDRVRVHESAKSLQVFSYTNYSDRAAAELSRKRSSQRTTEISYYRPVIAVQFARSTQLFALNSAGEFTELVMVPATGAAMKSALIQDPSGISNGLDLDVIQIGSGSGALYFSPETKSYVARKDILSLKEGRDYGGLTTAQLLELREINPAVADQFTEAAESLRNTRYLYTSEVERQGAISGYERAIRQSAKLDPLLPRRLLDRHLAQMSELVPPAQKRNVLNETMNKFTAALFNAMRVLNDNSAGGCAFRLRNRTPAK